MKRHVKEENEYRYQGPVYLGDYLLYENYDAFTNAVSLNEARRNIIYQIKETNGIALNECVSLPGKFFLHTDSKKVNKELREHKKRIEEENDGQLRMKF